MLKPAVTWFCPANMEYSTDISGNEFCVNNQVSLECFMVNHISPKIQKIQLQSL